MMSPTVIRRGVMDSRSWFCAYPLMKVGLLGDGDPLAGAPAGTLIVRERAAQTHRGVAHLVRTRACGADEELAAALGQGPFRAVEVRTGPVRAFHRDRRADPGHDERLRACRGQHTGGVRPGHEDRDPRYDLGEL